MDITLGPWTAELSVDPKHKPLAEAMGNEAWNTVKNTPGFTPKEAVQGKPAKIGFTISGKLTDVLKDGNGFRVFVAFTILIDDSFSNIPPVKGDALADRGAPPEDALRAVTDARIKRILGLIKAGSVKKAR